MDSTPSRREALKSSAAALLFSGAAASTATAQSPRSESTPAPGLTVRQSSPANLEAPFSDQNAFITPNDQFFVRSHFATPKMNERYTLKVEGSVNQTLELTLDDLKAMGAVNQPITLECAGNGRVFLTPAVRGLQWQFGGVSTAKWTGVPIAKVLERAGLKPETTDILFLGSDSGAIGGDAPTPGVIHYDRAIPLDKVKKPECMLVWGMNDQPLPTPHGGPLRAIIGGWYGMASVKWLSKIVAIHRPHNGFWQTIDYAYFERNHGIPSLAPITEIQPKSQIARPTFGENVAANAKYRVHGFAWAGEKSVKKVEISTDEGKTWAEARLTGATQPFCWQRWEYEWHVANTPNHQVRLLSRCIDSGDRGQPETRDVDRRTYMINHLVPVEVNIR